jgi:c-di-GMP-binding flagellar brake protein YcgR
MTFNGKYRGKLIFNGERCLLFDQISEVKEASRRSTPRVGMSVNVTVYNTINQSETISYAAKGYSSDISAEGVGLQTDDDMPINEDDYLYFIDFVLENGERFQLNARLARRKVNPDSSLYKYDYGFVFDYTGSEDEKPRLITEMLNDRIAKTF